VFLALGSLWAVSAVFRAVTAAMNVMYEATDTRPLWARFGLSVPQRGEVLITNTDRHNRPDPHSQRPALQDDGPEAFPGRGNVHTDWLEGIERRTHFISKLVQVAVVLVEDELVPNSRCGELFHSRGVADR
jgi:hypothetical protein